MPDMSVEQRNGRLLDSATRVLVSCWVFPALTDE